MTEATTLYRLLAHDGELLYVGVARRWPSRMAQHAAEKVWWADVASVRVTEYPTRAAALAAERLAISTDRPRYNIAHNTGPAPLVSLEDPTAEPPSVGLPLRRNQVVALGLRSGRCLVGIVETADDEFVEVTLNDWLIGLFCGEMIAVRLRDIDQITWAHWHRTRLDEDGRTVVLGTRWVFDLEPLANFQTAWHKQHAPVPA